MQDQAGGDARLMLGAGIELREKVIDLNHANGNVRNEFEVESTTQGGGEGIVADGAVDEGFMRAANKGMGKGRDGTGKRQLGAEQVGLHTHGGAKKISVVSAEITSETDEGKDFVGRGQFPAVQVRILRGIDRTRRRGAECRRENLHEGAKVRVPAEKFELALRQGFGSDDKESRNQPKKKWGNAHG
jgi:hypothetical protein